jgi:hypothetical protein
MSALSFPAHMSSPTSSLAPPPCPWRGIFCASPRKPVDAHFRRTLPQHPEGEQAIRRLASET